MFEGFGHSLPLPTLIVVAMSDFFKSNFIYIFIAFFIISMIVKKVYSTEKGRILMDKAMLRSPVFGPLLRKVAVSKFTRTLSTMLSAGVPILEALQVVAKTAGNKVIEQAVLRGW